MKRNTSILTFFLINFITVASLGKAVISANEDTTSFKYFKAQVSEIYNQMEFNDAHLNITKVEIAASPAGIAFAYFEPTTKKRYILLNFTYIYNRVWISPPRDTIFNTSKKKANIIKVILAHEWAHHYLGHIFSFSNNNSEINADILAGRILAQNNIEESAIGNLDNIFKNHQDAQHLEPEIRKSFIRRGFLTEEILKVDCEKYDISLNNIFEGSKIYQTTQKNKAIKEAIDKYDKASENLKIAILDSLESKLKKNLKQLSDSLTAEIVKQKADTSKIGNNDSISKTNQDILNTLSKSKVYEISQKYEIKAKFDFPKSIFNNNLITTFETKREQAETQLNEQLKKKDSVCIKMLTEIEEKFKDKYNIDSLLKAIDGDKTKLSDNDILTLGILYNKFYCDSLKIKKTKNSKICKIENLGEAIKIFEDKLKKDTNNKKDCTYEYKIKGFNKITFNKTDEKLRINGGEYKTKKDITKFFTHTFHTKKIGNYYIDKNNLLWTETLASVSLNDKIFLSRYVIINPQIK